MHRESNLTIFQLDASNWKIVKFKPDDGLISWIVLPVLSCLICCVQLIWKIYVHTAKHYSQVHRWLISKCAPHSSTALWCVPLPISCVSPRPSIMCVWTCWSSFNSSNIVCNGVVTQYMQLNHHHWWHSCSEIMIIFSFNVLVLALSHGPYCRFWGMFGTLVILCWLIQLHVSFNVQN